ncbi:unnamed protein product [Didymodactylos carnosus]|uniref:Scavenger receptor class B member 1 n=1 Tax=Didymodactylos carnosus TaxID=1234261 RepID=A0A8S2DLL3_9BILA|nr:unnamed protein product [Didymodactylos carnosus]CAF3771519.1 unnamed protein product [Didymodactylos carnosus]
MPGRFMFSLVILSLIFTPALILITQWPKAANWIHNIVLKKVQLYPQSAGYKTWIDSPVTTTRAYRLFNVTNYMTVMSSPNSPIEIQETDPFMYKLLIKKNDIEWFNDNTEVTYTVERFFERLGIFDKTLLEGEGAFVNIPRVLFRTRFDRKPDQNFFAGSGLNVFNYTHAVDLIEGFNSATFSLIRSNMMGPNTEKYGYIYRYNTSRGYNYTIRTGFNDSVDKGRMLDYKTEYNPTRLAAINVFQADFCRPVQLRYSQTIPMFGFDAVHEYVLRLVDYETCSHMNETCEESVYLDISKCFSDKDKHESTIYFEPITGTPIKAQLRIQLNTNTYIDRIKVDRYGNANILRGDALCSTGEWMSFRYADKKK